MLSVFNRLALLLFVLIATASCGEQLIQFEKGVLLDLRAAVPALEQFWGPEDNPCDFWRGITCRNVSGLAWVDSITLSAAVFPASLPFYDGILRGTLPPTLGELSYIQYLSIHDTEIEGTIPDSIGSLLHLTTLKLRDNMLSGTLPSSLGNMTSLQELILDSNYFVGTIPSSLGQLSNLTWLTLAKNDLSGKVEKQGKQLPTK